MIPYSDIGLSAVLCGKSSAHRPFFERSAVGWCEESNPEGTEYSFRVLSTHRWCPVIQFVFGSGYNVTSGVFNEVNFNVLHVR